MRLLTPLSLLALSLGASASILSRVLPSDLVERAPKPIAPRVFIISMFAPEAEVWYGIKEFNLLAHNITVPGFSPLFPQAHCTKDGQVCQLVTGEGGKHLSLLFSDLPAHHSRPYNGRSPPQPLCMNIGSQGARSYSYS